MSSTTFIALRYLFAKKKVRFLSLLSLISFLGVMVSVLVFLVVHSVMTGFSDYMYNSIVGFSSHAEVKFSLGDENIKKISTYLDAQKEVKSVNQVIELDGILQLGEGNASGVRIRGEDAEELQTNIKITRFDESKLSPLVLKDGVSGILLGDELFVRLGLMPGEEISATLVYPLGDIGPTGEVEPRRRFYKIVGVFSSGFYDYDMHYVIAERSEVRKLGGESIPEKLLITLNSLDQATEFKKAVLQKFPQTNISTWQEKNKRLFSALQLEKKGMFLLLSLVILMASLTMVGLFTLLFIDKTREIGFLYALGLQLTEARKIFLKMGFILGGFGTLSGFILGGGIVMWLHFHPLPLPPAYYLQELPIKIDFFVWILLFIFTPLIGLIAAWSGVRRLRFLNPLEVLKEI